MFSCFSPTTGNWLFCALSSSCFLCDRRKDESRCPENRCCLQRKRRTFKCCNLRPHPKRHYLRIYGCETQRNKDYEAQLADYEKASVRADLPVAALPPIYKLISMTGVLLIFYFGSKNVMGTGWTSWDIAAFSAFLSCFPAVCKSSHAPSFLMLSRKPRFPGSVSFLL